MSIFEATRNIVPQKDFSYIDIDAIDNKRHIIKSGKPTKKEKAPSRARRLLESGDVLFSLVRPYLENIALVENQYANAIASTGFYVVRSRVLFPGFAYILFLSPYVLQGLNAFMKGDNSPSIRSENIEDFLYPIPPLSEQQEIVKAFNEVEYKLDTLQQSRQHYKRILSETPTSLRQQLVQSAIQGQLIPQNPNDEPASVLLERVAQERALKLGKKAAKSMSRIERRGSKTYELFPDGSEKDISDEIPFEIPDSWEWCRFNSVFSLFNGDRGKNYPAKSKLQSRGEIPFISAINMEGGTISLSNLLYLSETQFNSLKAGKLQRNDWVICIRGSLGKYCSYPFDKGAIASSLVIARPNVEIIEQYMQAFMETAFFIHLNKYANGAVLPNLAAKDLGQFLFPLPPLAEQKRIVSVLKDMPI